MSNWGQHTSEMVKVWDEQEVEVLVLARTKRGTWDLREMHIKDRSDALATAAVHLIKASP